jgi:hypothetical protein
VKNADAQDCEGKRLGCNRFGVLAVAQIMAWPAVAIAQRLHRPMQRIDIHYDSSFALY